MKGLIILPIIIAFVALFIHWYLALKFEQIAFMKGYDKSAHSLAMCFWLGMIGYIYVAALPVKVKALPSHAEKAQDEAHNGEKRSIYTCSRIVVTKKCSSGNCTMCGDTCDILKHCKITGSIGVREIPICDNCILKFERNANQ